MTIDVRMPFKDVTPKAELDEIVRIMQSSPELGFVMKAVIEDAIAQNNVRGTLWAVYENDVPLGVAMIGSRRPYDHVYRTGDVTVLPEHRRKRLGTALYTATAMQGILEGRREVEETVIASLSPWMVYASSEFEGYNDRLNVEEGIPLEKVDGQGFLRSLRYKHYGTLPKRTGGFRDIQLWCHDPSDIEDYLDRLPDTIGTIEMQNVPHDRVVFVRNQKNYLQHDSELAKKFVQARDWIHSGAHGLVTIVRTVEDPHDANAKGPDQEPEA